MSRVLVIEDNRDTAESMRKLLEMVGWNVEVRYNGNDGVQAARQWHPDVVLCDIGLPGLDGFEVAWSLHADPATADALLVAITGYGGTEIQARAKVMGFAYFFTKPADFSAVIELIAPYCRS
jgi:CheY-like chemotaxis protein